MEFPKILLDLSYARLHLIFRCNQKPGAFKIQLEKNHNTYEILFHDEGDHDDWMLKLRKICVLTNFEKKYQVAEVLGNRGNPYVDKDFDPSFSRHFLGMFVGDKNGRQSLFCKSLWEKANHLIREPFRNGKSWFWNHEFKEFSKVRLMNEIEILRALKKKRVLNLREVHETEDSIYLVTDYVHDITLKKVLKTASSPFCMNKVRDIMYQLFKTLADMASLEITHRNLKPSNILMEGQNNIRLINFGLATYINGHKANVGICGTPGYIAPEILNSRHENRVYDDKVDVFSVGCIFFEMLLGYPLFKGSKASDISTLNKKFQYSDLIQLVMKEQKNRIPPSTKLGFLLCEKIQLTLFRSWSALKTLTQWLKAKNIC